MKILVIGDFHGKFPEKFFRRLKKENFDIIFSVGDFCGNDKLAKLLFKHYYAKNKKERKKIPKIIKDEVNRLNQKSLWDGIKILSRLKLEKVPLYFVHGNWDPTDYSWDIGTLKEDFKDKKDVKRFQKVLGKDFEALDFNIRDFGDFVLVGGASSTHPGKVDKKSLEESLKKYSEDDSIEARKKIRARKTQYAWRKKKYEKIFRKAKKMKKPIIFLTHNAPYRTKLDIIKSKKAHKLAKGKHYGSYLERIMIKRYKPDLVLCGHMHENFGRDKIGKSLIVNAGSAFEKQAVIVDFNEKRKQFKVKLIGKK